MARPHSSPVCYIFAGCLLALIGIAFLLTGSAFRALRTGAWPQVPCVIEHFGISNHPDDKPLFRPEIAFRYEWQGKTFAGSRLWPTRLGHNHYESLAELRTRLVSRFPQRRTCRVNPDDPNQSALLPEPVSIDSLVIAGSCCLSILFGISCATFGWRRMQCRTTRGPARLMILAAVSMLLGVLGGGGFVVWKNLNLLLVDRSTWIATPATMIWSRLETVQSRSTCYRVNVFYRYQFGGREYLSSHFDGTGSSTPAKDTTEAFVAAHPTGTSFTCFVNPLQPGQSVVTREQSAGWLNLFMLGVPLCVVGLAGLISLRDAHRNRR